MKEKIKRKNQKKEKIAKPTHGQRCLYTLLYNDISIKV